MLLKFLLLFNRALPGVAECGIKIYAKVQNKEAIDNFDNLLAVADGVQISRSSIANEIPVEKVRTSSALFSISIWPVHRSLTCKKLWFVNATWLASPSSLLTKFWTPWRRTLVPLVPNALTLLTPFSKALILLFWLILLASLTVSHIWRYIMP